MASMTMTASFLGGATTMQLPTTTRRGVLLVRALKESEKVVGNSKAESNNGRRELIFGVVAAAAYSVAKMSMADDEPKRGTPDAKKKYASVCVTNPTARICRY